MINLIPPSAHTQVKKEYWLRVVTVWMVLIGSAFLIVAILNIPLYVLVRSQLDAFLNEYAQASLETESFKDAERSVTEANEIASLLSRGDENATFSAIIAELENVSGNEVTITQIMLSRTDDGLSPITIHGTAASRLSLSNFQKDLEAHELFKNVVLPLSNLARDKDITFSITVEFNEPAS